MLASLHVKNIALIEEAEINFTKGLNILTGETGAGKSIMIDALSFALGKRMSKDILRKGADYALCELVFTNVSDRAKEYLKSLDIICEDDEIIMQRKLLGERNVCKLNGETVKASTLQELSSFLIDIHGQHEHQSLLYKKKHLEILDAYGQAELGNIKEQLLSQYADYQETKKEYEEAVHADFNKEKEIALAKFEAEEIDEAALIEGEDEELEADFRKMSNAKHIMEAISAVHQMSGYDSEEGAGNSIGRALSTLKSVLSYDEELLGLFDQISDIDNLLNDFNRAVADYESSLSFGEEEFEAARERLNLINHLKAKYGNTYEELMKYRENLQKLLDKYEHYEDYMENLQASLDKKKKLLLATCKKVSDIRKKQSLLLADDIKEALIDLNFLDAQFEIHIESDEESVSKNGYDDVEFMISTNPGEQLKSLIMVASGGELSRIMLALKTVLAKKDDIKTLIFDEIDTGISGRTAQKVSEKLALLSMDPQVICVTHLPQIAAMADTHFEIKKTVVDGRTQTSIEKLSQEASELELARMLGGAKITDAVLENAREMKSLAQKIREN